MCAGRCLNGPSNFAAERRATVRWHREAGNGRSDPPESAALASPWIRGEGVVELLEVADGDLRLRKLLRDRDLLMKRYQAILDSAK